MTYKLYSNKYTPEEEEMFGRRLDYGKKQKSFEQALNTEALRNQLSQLKQPQSSGRLIDPSAWIRELGGSGGAVGGAAAGAAAGSALMPGVGTVLGGIGGGILGAFGGGSAGSAVEQQVRDGSIDRSKVLKEGLQEAPWGALPGVGKAVGAARHAPKGARLAALMGKTGQAAGSAGVTDDVLRGAGKASSSAGRSTSKGVVGKINDAGVRRFFDMKSSTINNLQSSGKNPLEIGRKLMKEAGTTNYDDLIGAFGKKGSSGYIGKQLASASDDLAKAVKGKTIDLTGWYDDMVAKAKDLAKIPGNEAKAAKILDMTDDFAKRTGTSISGEDALKLKMQIDEKFGKAMMSVDDLGATANDVQKSFGNALRKGLKLDDDAAGLMSRQQDLILNREMLKGARAGNMAGTNSPLKGMSMSNTVNNVLRRPSISGRMARAGSGNVGQGMSFAGGKMAAVRNNPMKKQLVRSTVGKSLLSGSGSTPPPDDPLGIGFSEEQILNAAEQSGIDPALIMPMLGINAGDKEGQDPMAGQIGGFGGQQTMGQDPMAQQMGGFGGQQQNGMVIPREAMVQAMMADMQATGGENIDKMIKMFEFANFDALNTEDAKGNNEQQAKMQTAKTIVDNLMNVYQDVGGSKGVYSGTASDLLGRLNIGEGNEKARAYEQNRMSYLTPIIKAFGEVGVLTDKDREVVAAAIPSIKDSPAQAEQKLNLLYQMLMTLGNGGSISGQSEPDLLEQQLGGFVGGV